MLQRNQQKLKLANMASDLLIILLSSFFAWRLRFDVLDGQNNIAAGSLELILVAVLFSLMTLLALYMANLYAPQRFRKNGSNTFRIFLVNGICTLILMAVLYLFKVIDVPRLMLLISWGLSSLLISLKHFLFHGVLRTLRVRGYNLRHYLVIGDGHLALQYARNIRENPYTGIELTGYVGKPGVSGLGKHLGGYEQIGKILASADYDAVVAALEPSEVNRMQAILEAADKEGAAIELIPFFNDYYPSYPTFDTVGSSKLIDLRATPLNRAGNAMLKRSADLLVSFLALVILSPLMLAVALGVKLTSPGPVIFRQERMGRDKKLFTMYKFRSMRVTDSEKTGWSRDQDARKTRFGSLIRKTSLDELPQFWNVLKGDMSVIGPRPEVPYHVEHFKEEVPRYLVRQQVRPGITGWAQVNGLRGDTSIEERIRYDIEYIENWTPGLDLRIALRTLFGGMVNSEKLAGKGERA
ncbi:MAG: undecaprenyl-phosphate glucose phosphotransferase [Clostridia bacterium]|nr:undecaprenyl-phosphate glucose phosphotransferase [Clostridia bacterium]